MNNSDIKVSYTILTHNETDSLKNLLYKLKEHMSIWDEVIILDDNSTNEETLNILKSVNDIVECKVYTRSLNNDFASQKNYVASKCNNDYIFNIDADEMLSDFFMEHYKEILYINQEVEMFKVPRLNFVNGITLKHIEQYGWKISSLPTEIDNKKLDIRSDEYLLLKSFDLILNQNENDVTFLKPLINAPDYQTRIYKRRSDIFWKGNVHEYIVGYKRYGSFPFEKRYCILHDKNIDKQESQNNFYSGIINSK